MFIAKTAPVVISFALLTLTAPARAQDANEIRAWIQQLGSPRFTEREEAQRRLAQSDRAIAFVKQAVVNESAPEIRRRCTRLLDERKSAMRDDIIRELDSMARRGEYARGTAIAVAWRYELREKLRDYQTTTAKSLTAAVEKRTGRPTEIPNSEKVLKLVFENEESTRCPIYSLFAIRELELATACTCGFLVSGKITKAAFTNSIAFVNGPVTLRTLHHSILFVDGDLTLEAAIDSLIVCTGTIQSQSGFVDCTVICGGKITAPASSSTLRSEEKDLAALVRPWSAGELGIEPMNRNGRVCAGLVSPKSPMDIAGVEAGDVLLSLDGEPIATHEEAVKLLRRKSTEFLPFVLHVKRGERIVNLVVPWTVPTAPR